MIKPCRAHILRIPGCDGCMGMAGDEIQLEPGRIRTDNVIFPGEFNPHNVRLWVIGNEFGALCAVWADCEQHALDNGVDCGLLDDLLIEEKDADEDSPRLGNAGEPANLDYCWMVAVDLAKQELPLLLKLAECRGAAVSHLDDL